MSRKLVAIMIVGFLGIGAYLSCYSISSITTNAQYQQVNDLPTIVIDAGHPASVTTKFSTSLTEHYEAVIISMNKREAFIL